MPLGAREVLVAVRARDVASRVLREIGTNFTGMGTKANASAQKMFNVSAALTGVGVAMGGVGAAGIKFFDDSIDSFIEYNKKAALTKTQVDQVGVSVNDLAAIGKRVANKIPAPFENMQDALYDIFSSMDVNVKEAEGLLALFSKGAVAGQTEIRTAARSTISVMNAYKMPFQDAGHVMDVMFQLVRKGVGTYEEFNSSIGRAIPAAVSAGQSFETLAGMMAFLTRNGLSTQQAATSAARAMELFADPKRFKALEGIGVTVRDSSGRFLQMTEIIEQLANNKAWARMTEPERKEIFKKIFGQGTIQARRFFDTAIPNYEQFQGLTDDMIGSSGALGEAYRTMFDTPAMKAELLKNKYEILKTEIGEQLLPAKVKLIETLSDLIDKWNSLDSSTRKIIIQVAAYGSVFMTVTGVILTMVGAFGMLIAILAPILGGVAVAIGVVSGVVVALAAGMAVAVAMFHFFEGGIKGIIAAIAGFVAAFSAVAGAWTILSAVLAGVAIPVVGWIALIIAAVIGLALVIVKNWGTIKGWINAVWQTMQDFWDWISRNAVGVWHAIHGAVADLFGILQDVASFLWQGFQGVWDTVSGAAVTAWHAIQDAVGAAVSFIEEKAAWFWEHFGPGIMRVWNSLREGIAGVVNEIGETVRDLVSRFDAAAHAIDVAVSFVWQNALGPFVEFIVGFWSNNIMFAVNLVIDGFRMWAGIMITIISGAIEILAGIWRPFWDLFSNVLIMAFDIMLITVRTVLGLIRSGIELWVGVVQAIWRNFGGIITDLVMRAWNTISTIISSVITVISNTIQFFMNIIQGDWGEAWDNIKNIFGAAWDGIWAALQFVWGNLKVFFIRLPGAIIGFIGDVIGLLYNKGKDILQGLWNGATDIWHAVAGWVSRIPGAIVEALGNVARTLVQKGKDILDGLWDGIKDKWEAVKNWIGGLKDKIVNIIKRIFHISSPSRDMMPLGANIMWGLIRGMLGSTGALKDAIKGIGLNAAQWFGKLFPDFGDLLGLSGGGGPGGRLEAGAERNRAAAKALAASMGWEGAQWEALNRLIMGESGWRNTAQNPTSTAFGIFQFLDSTWATVGARKTSDPREQIIAGLRYIRERYGTPMTAYRQWSQRSPHWYEKGAWNLLTDQLAFLHKGEMVVPNYNGAADALRGLMSGRATEGDTGGGTKIGVYVENLWVRDTNVVDDLDWFTRSGNSGV